MVHGRRVDTDTRLAPGNARGHRILGRDRLGARRFQSAREGMDAGISARKCVICRQDWLDVSAAERHGPGVARGRIAEGIARRHREVVRNTSRGGGRITTDDQRTGRGGVDRDAGLAAHEGAGRRIRGRDRLRAGRIQGGAESVHAGIGGGERVAGRQSGLLVGAVESDRPDIAGGSVARAVLSGYRKAMRNTGGGRRWKTTDHQLAGGPGRRGHGRHGDSGGATRCSEG